MNIFHSTKKDSSQRRRKSPAIVTIVGLGLLAGGAPASAELSISGFVTYNAVDRDSEDDITFQRNGYAESRFKLAYSKALENGIPSKSSRKSASTTARAELRARRQEVLLRGDFGGVRFGQGNDAGDGVLNGDMSGTAVIQPIASQSAALLYSSANYSGFDPGRGERIRYDSPKFGDSGTISAQLGNDDEIEIALRYDVEIPGGTLRVGAFMTNTSSDVDSDSSGLLLAYGMPNGLNFALVTSSMDNTTAGEDGDFQAFKVGYKTGKHAVSLISGASENPGNPVETDSFGIAYVFNMDKGIELYGAVNEFDSDDDSADEDFVAFGTRVKF